MQYKKKPYLFTIHLYFLKSIYHIGHKSFKFSSQNFYHPLMLPFLFGVRKNLSILNVNYTLNSILKALYLMTLILKSKGKILIVNTNPDFYKIFTEINRFNMKNTETLFLHKQPPASITSSNTMKGLKEPYYHTVALRRCMQGSCYDEKKGLFQVSFCNGNWIGGTLTNWIQISESIKTYALFYLKFDNFVFKNNIHFPKYKKMKKRFQGLLLDRSPKFLRSNTFFEGSDEGNSLNLEKPSLTSQPVGPSMQGSCYELQNTALNKHRSFSEATKSVNEKDDRHFLTKSVEENLSIDHSLKYKKNEKKNIVLSFEKKPDIILLLNPNQNKNIIQEATILNIPIIAFTDSNTNLVNISYSIPTNNQSFSFYYYFFNFFLKLAFLEKKFGFSFHSSRQTF